MIASPRIASARTASPRAILPSVKADTPSVKSAQRAQRRSASVAIGGFGFSKFSKPKFVKPSKHRDLGSDKTENFERKAFTPSRPYSKDRPADRGFVKKPVGFTADRKYSKGPGKPGGAARGGGDFKRSGSSDFKRSGSDFKSGDFKRPGGDFKRSSSDSKRSEGRPAGRTGSFGKAFGSDRPRTTGGAAGKSPRFGTKLWSAPRLRRAPASSFGSASWRLCPASSLGSASPAS